MSFPSRIWKKVKRAIHVLVKEELEAAKTKPALTPEEKVFSNYLFEMGRFRYIWRSWLSKIGLPTGMVANDAEHSWTTTSIAVLLACMEGLSEAEIFYICFMCWIHDVPEVRTGDDDPNSKMYVTANEDKALRDIFGPTLMFDMAMRVFTEYKAKESVAAQIVKDADILDSVRELIEMAAKGVMYYKYNQYRITKKRTTYRTRSAVILHDVLIKGGPDVVWDHFLDIENTFTTGKYGK